MTFSNPSEFLTRSKVKKAGAIALLLIVTSVLAFFILYNANWVFGDDAGFLEYTAAGKYIPIGHTIGLDGRFNPLNLTEFNLLVLLGLYKSAFAHYFLVAVTFLLFAFFSWIFYKKIAGRISTDHNYIYWIATVTTIFLLTRMFPVFLNAIFPERFVIVVLSLFILLFYLFDVTGKWKFGALALIMSIYLTYYKEPVFLSLLTIALSNFLFNHKNLDKNRRLFHFILIINSVLFAVLYFFFALKTSIATYTGGNEPTRWVELAVKISRSHKLLVLALVLGLLRLYKVAFKKEKTQLFLDSLLFAGLVYAFALFILKLNHAYYYFPAVILCLPGLLYEMIRLINIRKATALMAVPAIYCSFLILDDIRENQQNRIHNFPSICSIAERSKAGYNLKWVEPLTIQGEGEFQMKMTKWKRKNLDRYMDYLLDAGSYPGMEVIHDLNKLGRGENILLYPSENEFFPASNQEFLRFMNENGYSLITEVGGIKAYSN